MQNIKINTKDGLINIQFNWCKECQEFEFCYKTGENFHKGVANGLSSECFEIGKNIRGSTYETSK